MPVRVGLPQRAQGLNDIIRNPIYATAVGLLIHGAGDEGVSVPARGPLLNTEFLSGIREWFSKHF